MKDIISTAIGLTRLRDFSAKYLRPPSRKDDPRTVTPCLGNAPEEDWRVRGDLQRPCVGPVLFLDIDGVLHPGIADTFIRLPLLEQFMRKHPSLDIVLSTSWRETTRFQKLQRYFSEDLRDRIVGRTPVLDKGLRSEEIEVMARHFHLCRYCAVDDDQDLFDASFRCLVLTDRMSGLTQAVLDRIDAALQLSAP